MNKLRAIKYIIKQSFINLARNWHMLLASVLVLFVCLFIMGALFLTSMTISNILKNQAEHPNVEIICNESVSDEASDQIYLTILNDPRINACVRQSKSDNLNNLKKLVEGTGFEELFQYEDETSEFLYVSFNVELKSADDLDAFAADMCRVEGIAEVQDDRSVYDYFTKIDKLVTTFTYVALVILGFLSILLTYNTIRLTVEARHKELTIMKYVGATYGYMRGPFIAEGIVIGILGAALSFGIIALVYGLLEGRLAESDATVRAIIQMKPFAEVSGAVLGYFMLAGIAGGLISSLIAIKKYIKV